MHYRHPVLDAMPVVLALWRNWRQIGGQVAEHVADLADETADLRIAAAHRQRHLIRHQAHAALAADEDRGVRRRGTRHAVEIAARELLTGASTDTSTPAIPSRTLASIAAAPAGIIGKTLSVFTHSAWMRIGPSL